MTPRRDFLGFTASAAVACTALPIAARAEVVVATASPGEHPDAALLHLAEQFIQHERAIQAWPCDALPGTLEDEQQGAEQRQMVGIRHDITLRLGLLRATTADGVLARARCLAVHNADGGFTMDDPNTTTGRLLRHLMRDAGALGSLGPGQPMTSPDAELLKACVEFDHLARTYLTTGFNHAPGSPNDLAADAERNSLTEAQRPLVARMVELRAATMEGQVARARSLALWDAELMKEGIGDTGECLTYAIVRDLLAGEAEE